MSKFTHIIKVAEETIVQTDVPVTKIYIGYDKLEFPRESNIVIGR